MEKSNLLEEIKPLIEQLQQLYKQAYIIYKPQVEHLIRAQVTDENTIQHLLDVLLDNCGDSQVLSLFKKLCRYYWDINPVATAEYVNFYREMWDSESLEK
jgi:hypothetical protein